MTYAIMLPLRQAATDFLHTNMSCMDETVLMHPIRLLDDA